MTIPFRYQIKGVRKITKLNGRALLCDSMGLGKSLQCLLFAEANPDMRPMIIVCPASLKWNWQREVLKHTGKRSSVLETTRPPEKGIDSRLLSKNILIINYDILHAWLPLLRSLKPQLIVLDEVQKIKGLRTRRTKTCRNLCRGVPHIIGVSGTPMVNRPVELWPILNILRPDLWPSFYTFGHAHCKPELTPWGWKYNGAEKLDVLYETLRKNVMIRRLKEDVMDQLPAKSRHVILLDLPNRKEYDHAVNDFASWLRSQPNVRIDRALRAQAITKITYLKGLIGRLKMPIVTGWVQDYLESTGEKLLLFGVHQAFVNGMAEQFGAKAVAVNGNVTGNKRQRAFDQFNRDKRVRLFVGNIDAAGTGWSCPSASATAFGEFGWTPGEHSQAEDRVHGIGRGVANKVSTAWYLVAKGTLEEKLVSVIQEKQKNLDLTLDGRITESGFNVMDVLIDEIAKAGGK